MSTEKFDLSGHRFTDDSQTLYSFSASVWMHCPACTKKAYIRADLTSKQSELKCPECYHAEKTGKWYGLTDLIVHERCGNCGGWIDARVR